MVEWDERMKCERVPTLVNIVTPASLRGIRRGRERRAKGECWILTLDTLLSHIQSVLPHRQPLLISNYDHYISISVPLYWMDSRRSRA